MDCNEAIAINMCANEVMLGLSLSNITIKTKIATPVIIGNNSYMGMMACFICVNESSNEPIVYLENYNPEGEDNDPLMFMGNYLETPFAKEIIQ